jgi:hypothetical protein
MGAVDELPGDAVPDTFAQATTDSQQIKAARAPSAAQLADGRPTPV